MSSDGNAKTADPSVVLLFGWMDARMVHLQKYVDQLQATFATSSVVVITSTSLFYFKSQQQRESVLRPIISVLQNADRGILVHLLSNGGGFQFMTLRTMLSKAHTGAEHRAAVAVVLDSVPGDHGLASAISSMAPANPLLRLLAVPVIALIYGLLYALNAGIGNPPIFAQLRTALNEPDVLPFIGGRAPRLYIFSANDRIVPAASVFAHAADAQGQGYDVEMERFADSEHVAHARRDPERYWTAVARMWARALEH